MSHHHHDSRPEDYYAKTYQRWRRDVEKRRRQSRSDDYYEKTYLAWRETVSDRRGRRSGSANDYAFGALPLGTKLRLRYAHRRWLIAADLFVILALSHALVWTAGRTGVFRNFGRAYRSMDEAADTPYYRQQKREMEAEARALERRNRERGIAWPTANQEPPR